MLNTYELLQNIQRTLVHVNQYHCYMLSVLLHDIYLTLQAVFSGQEIAGRINGRLQV